MKGLRKCGLQVGSHWPTNAVLPGYVSALCPDLPAFYQTLDALHQNCRRRPTVLYTVHSEAAGDGADHVRVTTMNGQVVHDVVVTRSVPLNVWQHVPLPAIAQLRTETCLRCQRTKIIMGNRNLLNCGHTNLHATSIAYPSYLPMMSLPNCLHGLQKLCGRCSRDQRFQLLAAQDKWWSTNRITTKCKHRNQQGPL